jgi:hypothetical protein
MKLLSFALAFLFLLIAPKMAEGGMKYISYGAKYKMKQVTITLSYLWALDKTGHVFMHVCPSMQQKQVATSCRLHEAD